MEHKLETLFDIVPNLHASIVDALDLEILCRQQQGLTMQRMAHWLTTQAKVRLACGETMVSKQLYQLADELAYLSTLPLTVFAEKDF